MPNDVTSQKLDWPMVCLHFTPSVHRQCEARGGWRAPRDCGRCDCYEPDPLAQDPRSEAEQNRAAIWDQHHDLEAG